MKIMKQQLMDLLNIHSPSGEEKPVRDYLHPILEELMDNVYIDDYGNLLATKVCGTGEGATIMLSAHMDTVSSVLHTKSVVENGDIITAEENCTSTVLGADDKAGIAIALTVLRYIPDAFNGTIKIAFSKEEEIGCIGADNIDVSFYDDVDLAIAIDRKGKRDIVVGHQLAFCSDNVGVFVEQVSSLIKMDYKCVEGGVSDAMIFSGNGINSINLSAGYDNEHTNQEQVSFNAMIDTTNLIVHIIAQINNYYIGFGSVPLYNKWVEDDMILNEVDDSMWVEINDSNGDIFSYGVEGNLVIAQNGNHVRMDVNTIDELYDKIKDHMTGGV